MEWDGARARAFRFPAQPSSLAAEAPAPRYISGVRALGGGSERTYVTCLLQSRELFQGQVKVILHFQSEKYYLAILSGTSDGSEQAKANPEPLARDVEVAALVDDAEDAPAHEQAAAHTQRDTRIHAWTLARVRASMRGLLRAIARAVA